VFSFVCYDVMTAFDFLNFLLSRQFHQQAGASILHLSFLFRDEGIYTWKPWMVEFVLFIGLGWWH